MTRTTAQHIEAATRLLRQEGADAGTAEERAAAAGRIYETLFRRLAPLIGDAGVRALFTRSVKLARADFPALEEISSRDQAPPEQQLVRCLASLAPEAALDAAVRVYATLFALMITFIGERLVLRVIESAFPATDVVSKETKQ